jgi:hypothetical protein
MSEADNLDARTYPELECSWGGCPKLPVMECVWTPTGEVWFRFCEDHRPAGSKPKGVASGDQAGV